MIQDFAEKECFLVGVAEHASFSTYVAGQVLWAAAHGLGLMVAIGGGGGV